MNKIIAVVGQAGSGKDTAANYIADNYNYKHVSTADILRQYITQNDLGDLTRQNMSKRIEELRKEKGNDVLVKLALEKNHNQKIVLSALRHPDESLLVKKLGGIIIDTRADLESRYRRNSLRNREGDNIALDDFKKLESKENTSKSFGITRVEEMADYQINNTGSYKDFYDQIDIFMKSIGDIKQ